MKCVLSIAGSDSSGGAGIQADIKTITAHNLFAATAITALTAQNTLAVQGVHVPPAEFTAAQIDSVFTDIPPAAVKTGMLPNAEIINAAAARLEHHRAANLVVDPVMISTSGCALIDDSAAAALKTRLFPLAALVTPNLAEAEALAGMKIASRADMVAAGEAIRKSCRAAAVLVKGGHLGDEAADVLVSAAAPEWFAAPLIPTANTHGTGCTLSAAIACGLALGKTLHTAVAEAKAYVHGAIAANPGLGNGSGPLNHMWRIFPAR